jgi:translation initiation factor 1
LTRRRGPPGPAETRLVYSTGGEPEERRAETPAAPAPASGVRLRLDRRASGRVVTVVTGLPGSPADLAELLKALKAACGAGGTVRDGVLELQGDHRDAVAAALRDRGLRSKRAGG